MKLLSLKLHAYYNEGIISIKQKNIIVTNICVFDDLHVIHATNRTISASHIAPIKINI